MTLTESSVCRIISRRPVSCFAMSLKVSNYLAMSSNLVERSSNDAVIYAWIFVGRFVGSRPGANTRIDWGRKNFRPESRLWIPNCHVPD